MTRTKIKEKLISETSSSMKKVNKQEANPVPDPCQAGTGMVKQEIKEEEVDDFTSSSSSIRSRKVIVKVVKVKVEHDVQESTSKSAPERLEYWRKGTENSTPEAERCRLLRLETEALTPEDSEVGFKKEREEQELLDSNGIKTETLQMTPGAKYARKREAQRLYQRKRRAAMTEEQRQRQKNYQKIYRQKYFQMPVPELLELKKRLGTCPEKDGEEFRGIPEEKSELLKEIKRKREELRDQKLKEKMTPEEFEEFKRKEQGRKNERQRLPFQRRRKELTAEQLEKRRQQKKEYAMKYKQKLSEEEKEERRRKRAIRTRMENLSEEAKARIRFRNFCRKQTKLAQMTEEEREEWTRRNTEYARKWRESLPPERLEKHREYMRKRLQKRIDSMDREEYLKEMRIRNRRCIRNESPEQRQKRLRGYKISAAVGKLRKRLKDEGIPPEEIKKRVEDLKKKMWEEPLPPLETVSNYKPRPRRNPIYNDSEDESEMHGDANTNTPIPKRRRRGRPPGSTYTTSTSPSPETDTTSMSPSVDNDHDHSLDFDSNGFHEDSSSIPATPADSSKRNEEAEVIVQFDLECPHCPSTYPQKSDLLAHISSEHPSQSWKCPLCRSIMLSPQELQEHFKAEHSNASGATNRNDTASSTAAHVTLTVTSAPLPPCEPDATGMGVAMHTPTPPTSPSKTFKCIKCAETDIAFESHEDLLEHLKSSHPESYFPCPKCNILKYTERSLNIHSKLCKGSSSSSVPVKPPNPSGVLLDCRKCRSVFKSQKALRIHVKYAHPESYWLCLLCNEWKYSEKSLYRHHKESCMVIKNDSKKEVKTVQPVSTSSSRGKSQKGPKSKKKAARN